jgi:hypothetical protein
MNLSLEFASVGLGGSSDGKCLMWIANGPVAVELDLWSSVVNGSEEPRLLCDVLLRHTAHLLAADESHVHFVPSIDEGDFPWQVGLRLAPITHVESQPPAAREEDAPGERVIVGDPAFRLVIAEGLDAVTLRTDRAGIESLAHACKRASERAREDRFKR